MKLDVDRSDGRQGGEDVILIKVVWRRNNHYAAVILIDRGSSGPRALGQIVGSSEPSLMLKNILACTGFFVQARLGRTSDSVFALWCVSKGFVRLTTASRLPIWYPFLLLLISHESSRRWSSGTFRLLTLCQ